MTASAASLEFRDVVKRYPGADSNALDHLSFEVPAGFTPGGMQYTYAAADRLDQIAAPRPVPAQQDRRAS